MAYVPMLNLPGTINCVVVREFNFFPVNSHMTSTPHDCSTTRQDQQHAKHEEKNNHIFICTAHPCPKGSLRTRHATGSTHPHAAQRGMRHMGQRRPPSQTSLPRPVRPANPAVPGHMTQSHSIWSTISIHPSF